MNFTRTYFQSPIAIVVPSDTPAETDNESLEGHLVAIIAGSIQFKELPLMIPGVRLHAVETVEAGF